MNGDEKIGLYIMIMGNCLGSRDGVVCGIIGIVSVLVGYFIFLDDDSIKFWKRDKDKCTTSATPD